GSRTADTQNRPANGRQSDMPGTPLRWRTVSGIRAGSSEMLDAARPNTTPCGLLKQPDKQMVFSEEKPLFRGSEKLICVGRLNRDKYPRPPRKQKNRSTQMSFS